MSDPFKSDTQDNDLVGDVAFDGHDGSPLRGLATHTKMPEDYWPIGLKLSTLYNNEGKVLFSIVAVKKGQYGSTTDEIAGNICDNSKVDAYSFHGSLIPERFAGYFKRTEISVLEKHFIQAFERIDVSSGD